jgi:hypothetical protein
MISRRQPHPQQGRRPLDMLNQIYCAVLSNTVLTICPFRPLKTGSKGALTRPCNKPLHSPGLPRAIVEYLNESCLGEQGTRPK